MQIFMCMRDSNFKTQDSRFKKPGRHISCLVPCTLYLVPCTLYLVPCTLYLVPCTLYLVPCTLYLVPCTLYLVPCTLYLVPCTLYLVPCTLYLLLSKMRFAIVAHANAITAAVFRQVQTPVGDAQQLIDGFHLFGGERGDPDADSDRDVPALHDDVLLFYRRANALGQHCRAQPVCLRQQHRDFLAAKTRHHIDSTHHMGKEAGHFHQYFIAGMVTEGVVDLLEIIDVE